MKKIKSCILVAFLCGLSITTISSQEGYKKVKIRKLVDIDTLSYLKIDKTVFYKDPIELKYFSLTDTTFIPAWYHAFCAGSNSDYFKDYPKEAIKYMYKDMGVTESMLQDHCNRLKASGGTMEEFKKFPDVLYLYVYGETWLTVKKTGDQYVLIDGIYSNHKIKNLRFNKPIKEKNIQNEEIDSLKITGDNSISQSRTHQVFINENDTLKLVNQMNVIDDLLSNDSQYSVGGDIADFKNRMFRAPIFIQSEVVNGKRVFETMKKGKEGHKKIKESNKP